MPKERKEKIHFPLTVNYGLSVESLVAHGKYEWKDDNITSQNFPTTRKGKANLTMEIVQFSKVLTSNEVIAELKKKGFRPAELHEMLVFRIKYPEEKMRYPIVEFGSVWLGRQDGRCVVSLSGAGEKRGLDLLFLDRPGIGYGRFLAVREP